MLNRSQAIYLIVACLLFTALIGLSPLLVPELMLGARAIPTLPLMLVIAIILILATLKAAKQTDGHEKRKRSVAEVKRYTVIQHFVDDLNTDERDYLRQLLNEQDAESPCKLKPMSWTATRSCGPRTASSAVPQLTRWILTTEGIWASALTAVEPVMPKVFGELPSLRAQDNNGISL